MSANKPTEKGKTGMKSEARKQKQAERDAFWRGFDSVFELFPSEKIMQPPARDSVADAWRRTGRYLRAAMLTWEKDNLPPGAASRDQEAQQEIRSR